MVSITNADLPEALFNKMEGPRPLDVFQSNGCSYAPDEFGGVDIRPACHFHDWAYHIGGCKKDRKRADQQLYRNLRACDLGKLMAGIYYRRVRLFGIGAFSWHHGKGGTYFGATGYGKSYTMLFLAKRMKAAYDICVGCDEFTQDERDHVHFYLAVRSIVFKLTKGDAPDLAQMNAKVQRMITEALQSEGVEEIFKMGQGDTAQVDIFDPDYLAKIEKIKLPNTRIKLLQKLLAKAIEEFKKVNKIKGVDFSQQFQALVDKYNDRSEQEVLRSEVLDDFTEEIIDLYHTMQKEKASYADLGIDFEEKAFYDILKSLTVKYDFVYPEEKLLELAKKVKIIVDDKARFTDWSQRSDIKAELKVELIILLAENGYPPIDRDEVYKEIFEQAENFKKYQGQGDSE